MDTIQRDHFVGTWNLESWSYFVDGAKRPLWRHPLGILIYTSDGSMSAILMEKDRQEFSQSFLSKGSLEEKEVAVNGYVSYAGSFSIDQHQVFHHVRFSLFPNWIGTDLVRRFEFSEDKETLTLSTDAVYSESGKAIQNVLIWKKHNKNEA